MRGNNKAEIYTSDDDRRRFLLLLGSARRRCGWRLHMYCLMGNHFHLLIETPQANIAEGMQWLNTGYARGFNEIYGRVGHLFQRRYADGLIQDEEHLRAVIRYIPLNPVKAGLVNRPDDWRWSSHRATLGLTNAPRFLTVQFVLGQFADDIENARRLYRDWVEAGLSDMRPPAPPSPLEEILGSVRPARPDLIRRARGAGYTFRAIARHFGVSVSTVYRWYLAEA